MNLKKTIFWITLFSIAMGFLETTVVIYLRKLYYPNGFNFPLAVIPHDIAIVELWREAATIIMLLAIGVLTGKNRAEKFAWFIYAFAIWDIFYYVFLWLFIDWPQSLFTWDILFLLPVPWVGPVIAPVLIAIMMILFALSITKYSRKGRVVALKRRETYLFITGSIISIFAFTQDYLCQKGATLYSNLAAGKDLFTDLSNYVPDHFNWSVFWLGTLLLLASWVLYYRRLDATKA